MTHARTNVLVWHRNWPVYHESLLAKGLAGSIRFFGAAATEMPEQEALATADCLLAGAVPHGVLARMPRLKWIQTVTVGVDDWLDRPDLPDGVKIVCARGVHRVQMPENILGALFHAAKPFEIARSLQRRKIWDDKLTSTPLAGQTLGVVGLGAIGTELARKAKCLEMRVVGANRDGRSVDHVDEVHPIADIDSVLRQSDYVVLLIPATPLTENLMNRDRFSAMKPGAWLMNFARGHVVDDAALLEALRSGHLAGAVLDAFREEPLPPEHPFWEEPTILVLPHLGGKHPTRDRIVAEIFSANLGRYVRGEPLTGVVDPLKGY